MVEIEIKKYVKDFTPFVSRGFAIFVVAFCSVIKISDPSINISHVLFVTLGLLLVSEMNSKMPSQLKSVNVSDKIVEFVYVKHPSTKLILSLVLDGEIQVQRSVITGCLKIVSGSNSIKLPWPIGKDIESKLKDVFVSIHNNSRHSHQ